MADRLTTLAVIGSGPNGILAAKKLLSEGFEVQLFDIGRKQSSENASKISNPLGLKMINNSVFPYDQNEFTTLFPEAGKEHMLIPSCGLGGFSTVWGATVPEMSPSRKLLLTDMGIKVTSRREIAEVQNKIISPDLWSDSNIVKLKPEIAIDKDLCDLCGRCLIGCPKSAIWNTEAVLAELESNPNFVYIGGVFVNKIEKFPSYARLQFRNLQTNSSHVSVDFAGVFLAAGVVSSSSILLRSKLLNQVELKETQIAFLPFLKLRSSPRLSQFGGIAQAWKYIDSRNELHFQIYLDTKYVISGKITKYPSSLRKVILWIWNLISPWIGIAIIYIDEVSSNSALLDLYDDLAESINVKIIYNKNNYVTWRKAVDRFISSTSRREVLTHRSFLKIGKFGASNHVRGNLGGRHTSTLGRQIILIDSLASEGVDPGPVTLTVLEETSKTISKWVDWFKSNY